MHHSFRRKPVFTERLAEVLCRYLCPLFTIFLSLPFTVLCDVIMILLIGLTELLMKFSLSRGHFNKRIFQSRSCHIGIFNTLPVNRGHLTNAHRLTEVIHSHTCLLGSLTRISCSISDTLHGQNRIFQFHTIIGKLTKVASHVTKAVYGLVSILSKTLKMLFNSFNGFTSGTHNCLNRVHFILILCPSSTYWLNCEASKRAF